MMEPPGVMLEVLVICRSASVMVTVVVEMLLDGVASGVVLVTWATLAMEPEAVEAACTVKVMVAKLLAFKLVTVPVTAPVLVASVKPEAVAVTSVSPVGNTSVTVHVEVYAERNPANLQVVKVTEANVTYVAIDGSGKPRAIIRD